MHQTDIALSRLAATASQTAGRAHRDGVLRGVAFLAVLFGLFFVMMGAGRTDPRSETVNARPPAPYAVAALIRE